MGSISGLSLDWKYAKLLCPVILAASVLVRSSLSSVQRPSLYVQVSPPSVLIRSSLYFQNPPRSLRTVVFDNFFLQFHSLLFFLRLFVSFLSPAFNFAKLRMSECLLVFFLFFFCLLCFNFNLPLVQSAPPIKSEGQSERSGRPFQFRPSERSHHRSHANCAKCTKSSSSA